MYPVLFRLSSFAVPSYTALLDLGLVGGLLMAYLAAKERALKPLQALDAALAAVGGGVIGARVVYVVANWAYYGDHVRQALRLWDGGLSWHGGLVGGVGAVLVYCAVQRASASSVLDVLTPGVAWLTICAWVGCFLSGCACGIETYPGQGALWALSLELPDIYGIRVPRVAVQLLGAGWGAFVLVMILLARRRSRFEGLLFPLWLALYAAGAFGLGFLRAGEALLIGDWRADQAVDLALAAIGFVIFVVSLCRQVGQQPGGL